MQQFAHEGDFLICAWRSGLSLHVTDDFMQSYPLTTGTDRPEEIMEGGRGGE